MGRDSDTSLAPGFRFHPTDEELVRYYLKRKVCNKPFRFNPISDVDVYKVEPWDLPDKSKLKTRDLEWYFFSGLDKKFGQGTRTNRATEKGYWKTTGKDREIRCNSRVVGMKKTLVYHTGRAPHGGRTNWVMHEYRLADEELMKAGVQQDAFVLCRIFQKSGPGPKNGEQYGAPFVEEEWEDNEVALFPGQDIVVADEVVVSNGAFVDVNDLDQSPKMSYPPVDSTIPLNFYHGEQSSLVEREFSEEDQKLPICMPDSQCGIQPQYGPVLSNLPQQNGMDAYIANDKCQPESMNNVIADDAKTFQGEKYLDVYDYLLGDGDGEYLEANDLSNPVEANSTSFSIEDCISFFDADDAFANFDFEQMMSSEMPVPDQEHLTMENVIGGTEQVPFSSQQPVEARSNDNASSSKEKPEATLYAKDINHPYVRKASHMLGNFPAPPALASEFPSKDAFLRLNAAAQSSSSSIPMAAGLIRITNTASSGNNSLDKKRNVNILLSFGLPQDDVNSGKTGSLVSRVWVFFMFFWVLIISVSCKIGAHIYTH